MNGHEGGLTLDLGAMTGWGADNPDGSLIPIAGLWDCTHPPGGGLAPATQAQNQSQGPGAPEPAYCAYEQPIKAAVPAIWVRSHRSDVRALRRRRAHGEAPVDCLSMSGDGARRYLR
jgi:hypothetical protein